MANILSASPLKDASTKDVATSSGLLAEQAVKSSAATNTHNKAVNFFMNAFPL